MVALVCAPASDGSMAAIRPSTIPTSRRSWSPEAGSITVPPARTWSKWVTAVPPFRGWRGSRGDREETGGGDDEHPIDGVARDAKLVEQRHDVARDVVIAPAAPAVEPGPDADVAGQHEAIDVSVVDERGDDARDVQVGRRPPPRSQQRVVEAEQVEPEQRATIGEAAEVVRPVDGGGEVAEDDPRRVRAGVA